MALTNHIAHCIKYKKKAKNACPRVTKKGVPRHSSNDQGNMVQHTAMKLGTYINLYVFQAYGKYGKCTMSTF